MKKLRLAGMAELRRGQSLSGRALFAAHNRRYARPAAEAADYHRRRPTARQLDQVFWLEEERVVSEDWVVRYKNRLLQLERQSQHWAPSRSRVRCGKMKRARIAIHYREQSLLFREVQRLLQRGARKGALPLPPRPHPQNRTSFRQTIIPGGKEVSGHDDTTFSSEGETTTRGHFYCGQTGDISNVV